MMSTLIPAFGIIITGGVVAAASEAKRWPLALFAMFWCGYNVSQFLNKVFL